MFFRWTLPRVRAQRSALFGTGWLLLLALGLPALVLPAQAQPPGYVADMTCAKCHAELFESFQEVGMARSLSSPAHREPIEDLDAEPYFHAPSGRYYEIRRQGDGLVFRRWRQDAAGAKVDQLELEVDWVLGSGHTSRVYLYGTPSGELFQLPLAWYTQEKAWAMAPGFDRQDHNGVTRRVLRECLFCHNAYPQVGKGSDRFDAFPAFPKTLPEGIGCQRCHGPGAAHVDLVFSGEGRREEIAKSIVNPARLPRERRREVCYQCHLQPSVSLIGIRRFGRDDYSFRPGEKLGDYLVPVEAKLGGFGRGDVFEINHHPFRLEQSTCFRKSAGELSCLTCHDPHRKVPPAKRVEHYRQACLSCHGSKASCQRGPAWAADVRARQEDCSGCHMPRRRTQDVVHVVMTDHKITRQPGDASLLAPLAEREPEIEDLTIHPLEGVPEGRLAQIYRALAVLRVVRSQDGLDFLEKVLPQENPPYPGPWLDLAGAQLKRQRMPSALSSLARVRKFGLEPPSALALQWQAVAEAGLGLRTSAEETLRQALELAPNNPELCFNLARLIQDRDPAAAEILYERTTELRPNLATAWYQLGKVRAALGKKEKAREAWQRALAFEPQQKESRAALEGKGDS